MCKLILIKHSLPLIDPALPARQWRLSEEGRQRCEELAVRVAALMPMQLFSSHEPKAQETAELVGARLNLAVTPVRDLHEHARENVPFLSPEEIHRSIKEFFRQPDALVFGEESARQTLERFTRAVAGIVAAHQNGDLAIVAHGTVITLLVAAHNAIDPYSFWQQLALPDVVVLELPGYRLDKSLHQLV